MSEKTLQGIATSMVAKSKGILAADESTPTIKKRFDSIGAESTEENRRAYRELILTAPGMEHYISGVIMFDETLRQSTLAGVTFPDLLNQKGVLAGIKVDQGTELFGGSEVEKFTRGLEGLDDRLKEYYNLGARFAKWRAVYSIANDLPSDICVQRNAKDLAEYAYLCQQIGLVPIVEPEVLMDGAHDIEHCYEVTKNVLKAVFEKLVSRGVKLDGIVLKPNMVLSGQDFDGIDSPQTVASMTVKCFNESVPAEVPGIVFLSGGQTEAQACTNLNAMNVMGEHPWELSYSFGRALQHSALNTWLGKVENVEKAQEVFTRRAKLTSLARSGKYKSEMEV
ncbi:MAG: class I fructose-bisphosphate aldolase [bacterium]